VIVSRLGTRHATAWSLALGVYFLTVWDLSLDPAMASPRLPIHFWLWHQGGPYFGMPVSNLVGWSLTGLVYMGLSRLLWRSNLDARRIAVWFPFGIYVANTGFAIALNLSAGLWIPVLIAVALGLIPASLVLWLKPGGEAQSSALKVEPAPSVTQRISILIVRLASRAIIRRKAQVVVEGLEYVPRSGPVLIAARHFHHLYDGCVLLEAFPRRLHILVALDWIQKRWQRRLMEHACAMVGWPVMLRGERLRENEETIDHHPAPVNLSVYAQSDFRRYLRRSTTDAVHLLRTGEALVVFPEAYPNIDPASTPKEDDQAFLPFRPGFAKLVEMAERDGHTRVAIVPAGFAYSHGERWHITLRLGQALFRDEYSDSTHLVRAIEERVRELSVQTAGAISPYIEETVQL
jgi:1-acyl-sn-glycerol-3-phosphate acyltransferase